MLAVGLATVLLPLAQLAATTSVASAASPTATAAAAPSGPGSITLHVQSARSVNTGPGFVHSGDAVKKYRWLVNVDDTGDPGTSAAPGIDRCLPSTAKGGSTDPDYADSCAWPSTRNTSGFAPIVAQGDETDLDDSTALDNLPAGKYLISVTADGFKIDGSHFTVSGGTQRVVVAMNPTPLPLTTLRLTVFNDNAPVDATYEVDAEQGLSGFTAHLTDVFGTVSVDYYGNPLCTVYQHKNRNGTGPILFDVNNRPIIDLPIDRHVRQRPRRPDRHPQHGPEPLRGDRHPAGARLPARRTSGSRPPPSRAVTTTTSGSRRAPPASTPSRPRAPSSSRRSSSASCGPRPSALPSARRCTHR